ncbi:MAG TPA: FUSC family protein [Myxococcota bacterium]|nr:FUSC family protein [Myxococcota bacterium]
MSLLSNVSELRQQLGHQIRAMLAFAPGKPALMLGVRTALATVVPLVVGPMVSPTSTTWMSTAGFMLAIADKGGSYRTRAQTMGGITLASAFAVALGALVGGVSEEVVWLAPLAMFVCAALFNLVGVLSPVAAAGGVTTAVLFCISLGYPPEGPELGVVLERGLATLAGGAWAMLLALFFWPVRVYRPARMAVARCYQAVAAHARLVHAPAHKLGTADWLTTVSRAHGPIRETIEAARAVLAATRRGRRGESGRGALLLVLLQNIDLLFSAVVALEDVLDNASRDPHAGEMHAAVGNALKRVEGCLDELALRIEAEGRLGEPRIDWTLIGSEAPPADDSVSAEALHRRHVAAVMMRLRDGIANAYDTTDRLYESRVTPLVQAPVASGTEEARVPLPRRLVEELRTHPLQVRHAMRVCIMATVAVIITQYFRLERGYWVTLNVVILLQPYTVATAVKTLQRVSGTALGGIVAALMMAYVQNESALLVIATLLAGVCASVMQLNYGLYAFFLTPTFVLLAEVRAFDVHLPELRIVNTVIGGVLALVGSRFFWPQRESEQLPDAIADTIRAMRAYFDEAMRALTEPTPAQQAKFMDARRHYGLKLNLAEASFQRRLAEIGADDKQLEPMMTLLLYGRRLGATCSALAAARAIESTVPASRIETLRQRVDLVLGDLENAMRAERRPAPLPNFEPVGDVSPTLALRLSRLPQQIAIIHEAVVRWTRAAVPTLTTPPHPVP